MKPSDSHPAAPAAQKRLWRILPWVVCVALFYYLFRQVPPRDILRALSHADIPLLVASGAVYFALILVLDCITLKHFIHRFVTPVTYWEILLVRGVTYLMMNLNYAAGQGGFAIYLRKTHKASVAKTLGTITFISMVDVLLVFTSALVSLGFMPVIYRGVDLRHAAVITVPVLYAVFILWAVFWRNSHKQPWNGYAERYRPVRWLLEHNIFTIFRAVSWRDYLWVFCLRAPMLIAVIGSYQLSLRAFQADIDWRWLYLYNPIIMFISMLPLTPSGWGTSQLLTVEFFRNVVTSPLLTQGLLSPKQLLFSSNLLWSLVNQLIKTVFGIVCLSRSSRTFFRE